LQEGPQAWCNSSSRGARVELLLQVGESHLYFLVKFHDLICYQCEIWNVNYQMLDIRLKEESLCNDVDILDSILNVCAFKVKGCCVNCQVMKLSLTKEIWEVWFGAWTSIYLVYIMILDKGIAMFGLAYTFSVC
jgi:hypothetical protein